MAGLFADVRNALHRGRPGSDDADALALEAGQVAVGVPTRVFVVPSAGVEGVALEGADAGDARQLGPVERTIGHRDKAGAHDIAAVGLDDPAAVVVIPAHGRDFRLEAGVVVEPKALADRSRVGQDLRREAVLLLRHVAEFLEQGQIDVRLDVALGTRVAVPVPRAAEVAAFLDDANVLDARLAQPRTGQEAAEAATDHHDIDVVLKRLAFASLDVGVVDEVRKATTHFDVLLVAFVA